MGVRPLSYVENSSSPIRALLSSVLKYPGAMALALRSGIDVVRPRGVTVQFGLGGDMDFITAKLRRTVRFQDEFALTLEFIGKGLIDVKPLGGIRRGSDAAHQMYEAVFKSPADVHVEFWDYTLHRAGDVFWAVGRERGAYRMAEKSKT